LRDASVYAGDLPVSEMLTVYDKATPEAVCAAQQLVVGARAIATGSTPGLLLLFTRGEGVTTDCCKHQLMMTSANAPALAHV
jgi:hypothetical protein